MAGCAESWFERLSAWHDGESDPDEARAVVAHLAQCEECAALAARLSGLSSRLRAQGAALERRTAAARERVARAVTPLPIRRQWPRVAAVVAASLLLLVGLGAAAQRWRTPRLDGALAADLERHHFKAFSRKTPCEFQSSDPAQVSRWIHGAVGEEVKVPTLEGAVLLGARRCRLQGELAVSLLYRRDEHPVTIFLPLSGSAARREVASFTGGGARCTSGPLGERICAEAAGSSRPVLAVSDLGDEALLGILQRVEEAG